MFRPLFPPSLCSLLGLLLVAACAAPTASVEKDPVDEATGGVADGSMQRAASGQPGDVQARDAAASQIGVNLEKDPELQEMVRQIWREPTFQRQLAQSWLRGSEIDPPLTTREAELRTEVLGLIHDEELDKAAARLRSRQGGDDVTAVFDYMLASIYLRQEKWSDAVVEYTKAVAKYPSYRRAWRSMAIAQMRQEEYASAARSFVQVINLGGNDATTWGLLATMHARSGDFLAAEQGYRLVAMLEPEKVQWRQRLANTLFQQGRNAEGASLLGRLIQEDPNNSDLYFRQARAFVNMNETDKAARNLEIVDQLGGSTFATLSTLGSIYYNDGLYDLAADAYVRAVACNDRGSHKSVLGIANRLASSSAYEASGALVHGIEQAYADVLTPADTAELLKLRARLAAASGATEEQVALLQKIVAQNQLDGDALIQLGLHYQRTGDAERAVFRFEQAARVEKFEADAKSLHAQLLIEQGKFQKALPLVQRAQELKPTEYRRKLLEYVQGAASREKASS